MQRRAQLKELLMNSNQNTSNLPQCPHNSHWHYFAFIAEFDFLFLKSDTFSGIGLKMKMRFWSTPGIIKFLSKAEFVIENWIQQQLYEIINLDLWLII